MSNQTPIKDKKQMMNQEQIKAVLAGDDPVQLKRLIALLGWYGNALLGGMEMRDVSTDPDYPGRERLVEMANKIYLAATPVFEAISDIVRPTEDESEALNDECENHSI
ncbi:hypothetical protein [Aeromonas caviae]|uniref:hypothetical protein n=1 Tax=Aeromonas caviae TaxID=648 RepID=UPI003EC7B76A